MLLALELVVLTIFVLLVSILYSKLASFSIKCDILRSEHYFITSFISCYLMLYIVPVVL